MTRGGLPEPGSSIAVVGGGVSGLAAAWCLARRFRVTLFEAANYVGGHTNTVEVTLDGATAPVDTGFLVYNERTYPNLIRLFAELGVPVHDSDMSFAVSRDAGALEWAGTNLNTVFAQRRNLVSPRFWSMVLDILRFNREATRYVADPAVAAETLGALLVRERYGTPFRDWYLVPMAAAIWSASPASILDYPAATFLRFCLNHALLQVNDRPVWKTVAGGGREYVRRICATLDDVRTNSPVTAVRRSATGVNVECAGSTTEFAGVVLATHAPDSLALLAEPTPLEAEVLGAIGYQDNEAILHTDASLLPRRQSTWSSWNFIASSGARDERPVCVSYLLNRLQPLPFSTPLVLTLNPDRQPDPGRVIRRFRYAHPVFDMPAIVAQQRLPLIQGTDRVWYAGAWSGYGFHEDGLRSGLRVADALGCRPDWASI